MQMRLTALLAVTLLLIVGCDGGQSDSTSNGSSSSSSSATATTKPADGKPAWLQWRGPNQNQTSEETNLPTDVSLDGPNLRWTYDLQGRGTAVTDGNHLYVMGYVGKTQDLYEVLACLDPNTGELIWEHKFRDFISDIIYNRYSIGAPSIDWETGNVYAMTSPGLLLCFTKDGEKLWEISMMEQYGRLTFPNGRTGAPTIIGDKVIVNAITSNWGSEGPARNRFYAFDKNSGDLIWSSNPGVGPPYLKDSSFSTPYFEIRDDKLVFYATLGDGTIICANAMTGEPIWYYQFAVGGVNSSVVLHEDKLIAVHGKENINDTGRGRMIALNLNVSIEDGAEMPVKLGEDSVLWRNDEISMFTSSPTIVDDTVYQCTMKGDLYAVDVETGNTNWHMKLGADQLHASPLYADGKLYVPMWNDGFYVIKPHENKGEVLQQVTLAGSCIGSPSVFNGMLYVHSTEKLYCFGKPERKQITAAPADIIDYNPTATEPVAMMLSPAELLLQPGETKQIMAYPIDKNGNGARLPQGSPTWEKWIPPTARVKSKLDAQITEMGKVVVADDAKVSAGAIRMAINDVAGTTRGRILPAPPIVEDFESFELSAKDGDGNAFAFPPLPWIGARLKWDVREVDGNKVLAKTLDRILFMRSMIFFSHPDATNYTVQADIMSDGNRRVMSSAGVINQRYIIMLDGNQQKLKVVSNYDRVDEGVKFSWKPGKWYTIKSKVQKHGDNAVQVLGKAWAQGEEEPAEWMLKFVHEGGHNHGSPGIWGLSPQSKFKVYVDNIRVEPFEE